MRETAISLRPHDICVALQICLTPDVGFRSLAHSVSLSLGEGHNATKRLRSSRLVHDHALQVVRPALLEFLCHGVRYAFPGELGSVTRGVPTAHSGPPLAEHLVQGEPVVWPHHNGKKRGSSLAPLCSAAPQFAESNVELYHLLTLVDALRIGQARERELAQDILRSEVLASAK